MLNTFLVSHLKSNLNMPDWGYSSYSSKETRKETKQKKTVNPKHKHISKETNIKNYFVPRHLFRGLVFSFCIHPTEIWGAAYDNEATACYVKSSKLQVISHPSATNEQQSQLAMFSNRLKHKNHFSAIVVRP